MIQSIQNQGGDAFRPVSLERLDLPKQGRFAEVIYYRYSVSVKIIFKLSQCVKLHHKSVQRLIAQYA